MKRILVFISLSTLLACLVSFLYPTLNFNRINISPLYTKVKLLKGETYQYNFQVRTQDHYQLNLEYRKSASQNTDIFDPQLSIRYKISSSEFEQESTLNQLPIFRRAHNLTLVNLAPDILLKPYTNYQFELEILEDTSHRDAKAYLELSLPPASFSSYYEKYKSWYSLSLASLFICMVSFTALLFSKDNT